MYVGQTEAVLVCGVCVCGWGGEAVKRGEETKVMENINRRRERAGGDDGDKGDRKGRVKSLEFVFSILYFFFIPALFLFMFSSFLSITNFLLFS